MNRGMVLLRSNIGSSIRIRGINQKAALATMIDDPKLP